ncbi:MAG: O-antigen ligase family protein, partial [Acidimicrobiales bacterium]
VSLGLTSLVAGAVGAIAILESVWATLQLLTGSGLGLTRLGEDRDPFYVFAKGVRAPMGSMVHIYVLAGLALVGAAIMIRQTIESTRPAPWAVATAVAIAPVGFTFSRAALIGFVGLVVALTVGAALQWRHRAIRLRYLIAVGALCLGAAVPAAVWHSGWRVRSSQTSSASTAAALTTERTRLDHEALQQISAHPLTGVGPGRYVPALKARFGVETDKTVGIFKPVHDIVLLVGAEGGIGAGLIMVLLLAGLGWRALRSGPAALGLYASVLPFFLLDHFLYSFPQGLVITALWLAGLDSLVGGRAWRPRHREEGLSEPRPAPA